MSYRTRYTLTWDDVLPEPMIAEIVSAWRKESCGLAIDDDGSSEEACCWYEHEADLKELSLRAPDVLFTLDCVGEDFARWRVMAKAGAVHRISPILIFLPTPISPRFEIPMP